MTSTVPSKPLRVLHSLFQSLILSLPKVSEGRLALDRTMAFLKAWHYISRAKIEGDYLEFGVFEGLGFKLSLESARKFACSAPTEPRFFAFDSFEGLPAPDRSRDNEVFQQGEYSASRKNFERAIRRAKRGRDVRIIAGFFDQSLKPSLYQEHTLVKAAFVTIDCDLYSSTLQALEFVTPLLQTGTVLYFDDWYFSGGDITLGEAGACLDWLGCTQDIHLLDFGNVGIMGKLFLVNKIPQAEHQAVLRRLV